MGIALVGRGENDGVLKAEIASRANCTKSESSASPSEDEGHVRAEQEPLRRSLDFARQSPSSSLGETGDDGWHIDVSFGYEHPDFMEWRANVSSKGRALLMLFLFSDVDVDDAPTRIRVGSHADIARQLAPAGEAGLTLREVAADGFASSAERREELALGNAGTVYLCHPFLVHAAQRHRGTAPRFMAQPPLMPREPLSLHRQDGGYSPVEQAIVDAISAE